MLNSPENNQEIFTNEISVQVESFDLMSQPSPYLNLRKKYLSKNFKFDKRHEFDLPVQQFLSNDKKPGGRFKINSIGFGLNSDNQGEKLENVKKKLIYLNTKVNYRCKSGFVDSEKNTPGVKSMKNRNLSELKLVKPAFADYGITKCPSAYQIPHVFDPLSNFVATNIPVKLSKLELKPRKFKAGCSSANCKANPNKKLPLKIHLSAKKDPKVRCYLKHIPKTLSLNV